MQNECRRRCEARLHHRQHADVRHHDLPVAGQHGPARGFEELDLLRHYNIAVGGALGVQTIERFGIDQIGTDTGNVRHGLDQRAGSANRGAIDGMTLDVTRDDAVGRRPEPDQPFGEACCPMARIDVGGYQCGVIRIVAG